MGFSKGNNLGIRKAHGASFAKSFSQQFGFTSYGADGGVGPGVPGYFNSGNRDWTTSFYRYNYVTTNKVTGYWVSNGKPSPVYERAFNTEKLTFKIPPLILSGNEILVKVCVMRA